MKGCFQNVCIKGITAAVPNTVFDNLEYAENQNNKRLKKQIKLTGITQRRVSANGQGASDLALIAAKKLLHHLGWDSKTISVLIFVTQSPDLERPSTAFIIHGLLEMSEECLVYDINMGCTGYIGGMTTICSILESCKGRGLLLVGESTAKQVDYVDYGELLYGNAASATALEYNENSRQIYYYNRSDGTRVDLLYKPFNKIPYMDGNAILLFSMSEVAEAVKDYLISRTSVEEIDYYVFHQAQKLIIDGIIDQSGLESSKALISCDRFGNTSSASIPLTLVVNREDFGIKEKRVLLCGYGIGLCWGMIETTIDPAIVLPLIESDVVYEEIKELREGTKNVL